MNKRVFVIEGLSFLFIGLVFLLNSFSSITGAVVLENVGVDVSGLLGLVFVIAGLVVMIAGEREKESKLVREIENVLRSGAIKDPRYLLKVAEGLGCVLRQAKGDHIDVYDSTGKRHLVDAAGRLLTIDLGGRENTGSYRKVLKALHTYGEQTYGTR